LKNVLNQQLLWERYRRAEAVIEAIRNCKDSPTIDKDVAARAVLTSLEVGTVDFDWANVVGTFYSDFQTEFRTRMQDAEAEMQITSDWPKRDVEPWKAVGDELIYVFEVCSRRQLHWIVIAFLAALRRIDSAIADQNSQHNLRLKGSAWVAGFPVRNRQVRLPGKQEAFDYLGPEVDAGFRIGKCTRPGMLAVSVELAELLAEIPTALRPMTGMIVGWEQLKGVWDDKHYPVIWVDFPTGHLPLLSAKEIDDWEVQESKLSKEWKQEKDPKPNLPQLQDHLTKIRKGLPSTLGIINPYIITDPEIQDEIEPSHFEIQSILQRVTDFMKDATSQDANVPASHPDMNEQQIESLVNDALTPISADASADDWPTSEP
jgi:hypothetical protein